MNRRQIDKKWIDEIQIEEQNINRLIKDRQMNIRQIGEYKIDR